MYFTTIVFAGSIWEKCQKRARGLQEGILFFYENEKAKFKCDSTFLADIFDKLKERNVTP